MKVEEQFVVSLRRNFAITWRNICNWENNVCFARRKMSVGEAFFLCICKEQICKWESPFEDQTGSFVWPDIVKTSVENMLLEDSKTHCTDITETDSLRVR